MDRTPTAGKHYEITTIAGDAYAIERRGLEIESLGEQMIASSDIIAKMKLGAECRGKSLDALKDDIEDVEGDLRKAGERYKPSGTAFVNYARTLDKVQTRLNTLMPEIETAWTAYTTAAGSYDHDSKLPPPKEGDPPADDRTTQGDVDTARAAWEAKAVEYEHQYDSWWGAYEQARKDIKSANDNGVHDSFWDDALPFLEALGTILSYAGIVLAVLACIIGGPFILIGAIVGLAALAVTVWKVSCGRGTALDIVMAAVGVFPFGKAFALAKGLRAAPAMSTLGRGLLSMGGDVVGAGWRNGSKLTGLIGAGRFGQVFHASGALNRNGTRVMQGFFNGLESPSVLTRLLRGKEGAWTQTISDAASGLSNKGFNNLNQFLGNARNGGMMQEMLSGGNRVTDFLDGMGKASAGFAYDRATGGW
ncbi:hypothetical protein [Microbacterium xylanilyticum]